MTEYLVKMKFKDKRYTKAFPKKTKMICGNKLWTYAKEIEKFVNEKLNENCEVIIKK